MKKDIIFYSNYCTYSKEIINQISKTPINDNIVYVSVDDDNIELPPFIKAVPTVYLVNDKKIVVDEAISEWIKEKVSKPKEDTLQPYFGSNDSSFASSCSSIDEKNSNKPFISSYTFLGDEQKIETPKADNNNSNSNNNNSSNNNSNKYDQMNSNQSSFGNSDYDKLQQQRNSEFQPMSRS